MKITNRNIFIWFLFTSFILMILSPNIFGMNDVTEFFRFAGIIWLIIFSIFMLIIFFQLCYDGDIEFEIDLLKPFRSRHIPPEEEDKNNK